MNNQTYTSEQLREIAQGLAERLPEISSESNCIHRQVGSLLYNVRQHRVISTGTNKTPSEASPCVITHSCTKHDTGKCPIIHSEVNCILNCLKNCEPINNSEVIMVCTYSPCYECGKVIVSMGIQKFYYLYKHHRTDWNYLKYNGVELVQLEDITKREEVEEV